MQLLRRIRLHRAFLAGLLLLGALAFAASTAMQPAAGGRLSIVSSSAGKPVPAGATVWFAGQLDGKGVYLDFAVNGVAGGNEKVGRINSQNGMYVAPAAPPPEGVVTISGATSGTPRQTASLLLTFAGGPPPAAVIAAVAPLQAVCGPAVFTVTGTNFASGAVVRVNGAAMPTTFNSPGQLTVQASMSTNGAQQFQVSVADRLSNVYGQVQVSGCGGTAPPPVPAPPPDAPTVAAARLLEQAAFGPTPAELAQARQLGAAAWIEQQLALPATALPATADLDTLRRGWYMNLAAAPDQLRQRVVFALSQLMVVSADKNPYGNEMRPWLQTLSDHAFGNFHNLLREMTLNPAMGKYLDMGNSIAPAPNENYAREVMQLFTIGPVMLNPDGSVKLDGAGNPLPSYDQATIVAMSRALSGWTYAGAGTGINWENFSGPLQARDAYHDKTTKTLLSGLVLPANQSARQDYDAAMANLFNHPNVPPFIATRLIRALVTSNPSPAYIQRVATAFASGPAGRGDMKTTLRAVLLDPEARQPHGGKLKDPLLHTLSLVRAMGGKVIDPGNLFWSYYNLGQQLLNAPSVFSYYSPNTRLPGKPQLFGPEFQIYTPALAVQRANFVYCLLTGEYKSMIALDIAPYVNAAGNANTLIALVDASLLHGRMRDTTRAALATALAASTDNRDRALTALYLTAISADFTVQH